MSSDAQVGVRVAMNAVSARSGGALSYVLSQVPPLSRCVDLEVFVHPGAARALRTVADAVTIRTLPRWAAPLLIRLVWEHIVFPHQARNADVLYSMGSFPSWGTRKPQVVVVLIPYLFGDEGPRVLAMTSPSRWFRLKVKFQRRLASATLNRAAVLVAPSEFGASQIRSSTQGDVDVRVIALAGATFPRAGDPGGLADLDLKRPYALSVAGDPPHKDQAGLIRSWPRDLGLDLLLVGNHDRSSLATLRRAMEDRQDVRIVGRVPCYGRLFTLYREAAMLVAHSLLEGFGMTPLEAMAAGTPVVASDIPAHREVCEAAAIYYDALEPRTLGVAVERLLADTSLQRRLVAAGRKRLDQFSWADNAGSMGDVLKEVGGMSANAGLGADTSDDL